MKTAVIMDETKMKKRKLRFWLFFGFFATVLVAAIVCGIILGNHILKSDYEKLQTAIKNNDLSAMISLYKNDDLLDYEEAIVNYEKSFLGNSNANILQDGRICTYDDIVLDATNGSLVKIENNESKTLVNEPVSYVNVWNDIIYYRLESTKQCMAFSAEKSTLALEDVRVGQMLIDNGKLFFVNLDDNAHLYSLDLESGEIKPIINTPIQYFAITGNKVVSMSRTNKFAIHDKKNGIYKTGMLNAKSFIFTDKLYLSDGRNIISSSPNLREEEKITNCEGELIAVFDNGVVLQQENALIYVTDNMPYLVEKEIGVCKYAALIDDDLTLIIGRTTKDGYSETKVIKKISDIVQESNVME